MTLFCSIFGFKRLYVLTNIAQIVCAYIYVYIRTNNTPLISVLAYFFIKAPLGRSILLHNIIDRLGAALICFILIAGSIFDVNKVNIKLNQSTFDSKSYTMTIMIIIFKTLLSRYCYRLRSAIEH